jgi:hypothetical protein
MQDTGDALFVLVLGGSMIFLMLVVVIAFQMRLKRRIADAGSDAIRVRIRAARHGYASGLVPVLEELLQRVERLEAEQANHRTPDS